MKYQYCSNIIFIMFRAEIARFLQYFRNLPKSFINILAILQDFNGIFFKYSLIFHNMTLWIIILHKITSQLLYLRLVKETLYSTLLARSLSLINLENYSWRAWESVRLNLKISVFARVKPRRNRHLNWLELTYSFTESKSYYWNFGICKRNC